jgi:predicted RNA polymerase sigma factor
LLALMCFHTARFKSRLDDSGNLLLLTNQNRNLWDKHLISKGIEFLDKAIANHSFSAYHLEAAIAKEHCIAESYEKTNWKNILQFYDLLFQIKPSAIIALNRAIIIAEIEGAEKGIEAIQKIENLDNLKNYYLYYAILGDLYSKSNRKEDAIKNYQQAIKLTQSHTEIHLLQEKIKNV